MVLELDNMLPAHQQLTVCEDAPLLPKQLEVGRAGFHVERVYVACLLDEDGDYTWGWWCLISMTETAEEVWRNFYKRHGFERVRHGDEFNASDYLDAHMLMSGNACITDKVWMKDWLLQLLMEDMPVTQVCGHRVRYQLQQLTHAVEQHVANTQEDWPGGMFNVECLTTNDLRVLYREYYSYEILVDDQVVYVGKGKGQRCASHLTREEFQGFDEVNIRVYRQMSEQLAMEDEARRIRMHGLDNLINKVMPSGLPMQT